MTNTPRFLFTQKAFLLKDNCLLAAKKSAKSVSCAGFWELPGGRIEFGEDLDTAFCRELHEETGLAITPGRVFHNYTYQTEPTAQIIAAARHATCADFSTLSTANHMHDENIECLDWIPLADLDSINWIPNLHAVIAAYQDELRVMGVLPPESLAKSSAVPQRISA